MKFYKLAFLYSSFNTGYSLLSFPKWIVFTLGIGSAIQGHSLLWIIFGGFLFFLFCIGVGILAFKKGWVDAVSEVSNRYNPFMKEVRNSKIFKEEKQ